MPQFFRSGLIPAILLVTGWTAAFRPLEAADDPLGAIPREAGLVVRLRNPRATVEKLAVLADGVFPILGTQIRAQSGALGTVIANPTLAGVDDQNDWWMAVFPHGGAQEADLLFLIPAADVAAMKKGLGPRQKLMEHGKLAVYTDDADTAERTLALLKGSGRSIAPLVDAESRALFDRGDVSVFLNLTRLTSVYRAELRDLSGTATELLEGPLAGVIAALGSDAPEAADRAAAELVSRLAEALTQGLEDSLSLTATLTISNEGLASEELLRVAADSETGKFLAASPPDSIAALNSLPAGGLGYLGAAGHMAGLMPSGFRAAAALADADERSAQGARAALAELQKLKHSGVFSSFALGSIEDGAFRSITVSQTDDPPRERALAAKLYEAVTAAQVRRPRPTFELKPDAERHGSHSADVLKIANEAALASDPVDAAIARRKARVLYGPEGNVSRLVYLKDRIVRTTGGGQKGMDEALAALEETGKGAGSVTSFEKTRAQLGEKSHVVALFDLPSTIAKGLEVALDSEEVPLPLDRDSLRNLLLKPSYMGLSLSGEPQGLRMRMTIPAGQLQGLARVGVLVASLLGLGG